MGTVHLSRLSDLSAEMPFTHGWKSIKLDGHTTTATLIHYITYSTLFGLWLLAGRIVIAEHLFNATSFSCWTIPVNMQNEVLGLNVYLRACVFLLSYPSIFFSHHRFVLEFVFSIRNSSGEFGKIINNEVLQIDDLPSTNGYRSWRLLLAKVLD